MRWPWTKRKPEKILKAELLKLIPNSEIRFALDREYSLPTNREVFDLLGVDNRPFIPEQDDCDDFAFRAKGRMAGSGYPFAVAWIDDHVINGWLNDQREWVWMEPQTRLRYTKQIIFVRAIVI
jgi:hypothetical protein